MAVRVFEMILSWLADNKLNGEIPRAFGNLKKIKYM